VISRCAKLRAQVQALKTSLHVNNCLPPSLHSCCLSKKEHVSPTISPISHSPNTKFFKNLITTHESTTPRLKNGRNPPPQNIPIPLRIRRRRRRRARHGRTRSFFPSPLPPLTLIHTLRPRNPHLHALRKRHLLDAALHPPPLRAAPRPRTPAHPAARQRLRIHT
jgi:hypothetical protein